MANITIVTSNFEWFDSELNLLEKYNAGARYIYNLTQCYWIKGRPDEKSSEIMVGKLNDIRFSR